jgi:DNA-binding MarR family transcriptional regulator
MPRDVEDIKTQAETDLSINPNTQKADVLRILVENPETAFRPSELADHADIPTGSASTVCSRLAEMGAAVNDHGHYYLPQEEETAEDVRRAVESARQQEVTQEAANTDEEAQEDQGSDAEEQSPSDEDGDAESVDLDEFADP